MKYLFFALLVACGGIVETSETRQTDSEKSDSILFKRSFDASQSDSSSSDCPNDCNHLFKLCGRDPAECVITCEMTDATRAGTKQCSDQNDCISEFCKNPYQ